jgi:nicotinamide mononucleotide transporter
MPPLFDIDTVLLRFWGYPLSGLELAGVLTGGLATWLVARNNVWTWPVGVVSTGLFFALFYQIRLYPDMGLQVFFLVSYLRGWWRWTHPDPGKTDPGALLSVSRLPGREAGWWLAGGAVATAGLGFAASRLHEWLPALFSQPGSFPYLDSLTTVLSVIGTFLMIQKRLECWWVWLMADAILAGIYYAKDVRFLALEYAVFCGMAAYGAQNWTRLYRQSGNK